MATYRLAALFMLASSAAAAQTLPGDPDQGRLLAQQSCISCHVIAPHMLQGLDDVPTFAAIARNPATTELRLRVFLQTPHRPMPNFLMSLSEIDHVISYILTLRR